MRILAELRSPTVLLLLASMGLVQCGGDGDGDGGSSPTVTITPPGIVSPASGSQVSESRPTLTVSNSTVSSGSVPTYTFQVATDSGFSSIAVQQSGVAQGSGGQTSWQITQDLQSQQYFWRARAEVGSATSTFSQVANFTVSGGIQPGDTVVIRDPLTDGTSQALEVGGGEFTSGGWRVVLNSDYLRYEVDAISNGFVQWQNTGLAPAGPTPDSHMLFVMWDPSAGRFRQNPYRVNIQKLWPPTHNPPFLRFRWISVGIEEEDSANKTDWDPRRTYSWRVQWGPEGGAQAARVYLDGVEIMSLRYDREYLPNTHWIEFGIQERAESVVHAVYSNVVIGKRP